jgi:hypothetical protein
LFKQYYCQSLPDQFWTQVKQRAHQLYTKFHSVKFQQKLINENTLID